MKDPFSLNWLRSSSDITCLKVAQEEVILEYYVFGKNPRLFISSGIHGDEYKLISSVSKSIEANLKNLPSFIYIPIATPSAVERKTRRNKKGQDVNRGFFEKSKIDESKAMMKILTSNTFDLTVSFHEDPELSEFYMYDSIAQDEHRDVSGIYTKFKQEVTKMGIEFFSGIDDPNDPDLGHKLSDGYLEIRDENYQKEDGQLESWIIRSGIAPRNFNPEIPEGLEQKVKDKLIQVFFRELIIPFF